MDEATQDSVTAPEVTEKKKIKKDKKKSQSLADVKKKCRQLKSKNEQTSVIQGLRELSVDKRRNMSKNTGFLYDKKMSDYRCLWNPAFPECPERLLHSYDRCVEYGLVERCVQIQIEAVCEDKLLALHTPEHIELMKRTQAMNYEELQDASSKYDSIFLHNNSYDAALLAAGGAVQLAEQVVSGHLKNGLALVRPPGHHANSELCGYSYFNNVAIAAKHVLDNMGLERVLIVDWDVHHGQATQQMFYDDPRVLYFSIHRFEYGFYWPNLRESNYDYIGEGKGRGFNINVPLNTTGLGNSDYMAIFQQLLMPVAYEFAPQIVLVSAGYDGAVGCPEFQPQVVLVSAGFDSAIGCHKGEMKVEPACFPHFIHMLSPLADNKLCVVLEGGYNLKSLAESVALTLRGLLGDPCPAIASLGEPSDVVVDTILSCICVLRPYWKSLCHQAVAEKNFWVPNIPDICDEPPFITAENKPSVYSLDTDPPLPQDVVDETNALVKQLIKETDLSTPPNRTCYVYDEAMRRHRNTVDTSHPERPDRITKIFNAHKDHDLLTRCIQVESRRVTHEELLSVHCQSYIEEVESFSHTKPRELFQIASKFTSIYLLPESYDCALLSAGSLLNVVDAVLSRQCLNGVAFIRPPGHHAEKDTACGFCLFNNVPVAARYAQRKFGVKRVLIVDWDVHHGNGTQSMLEGDPSILYISQHRYDNAAFFPRSTEANYDKVGKGEGRGFNINIPWNGVAMGDNEYIAAFQQIIMPVAYEFAPELVLVSAGFDAARGDPLGGYRVSPEAYAHMTHMLMSLANGRVILALEGGYNLYSISQSFVACTSSLLGDPCPPLDNLQPPCLSACISIGNVLDTQRQYWKCLQFRVKLPPIVMVEPSATDVTEVEPLSDTDLHAQAVSDVGAVVDAIVSAATAVDKSSSSNNVSEVVDNIAATPGGSSTDNIDKISQLVESTLVISDPSMDDHPGQNTSNYGNHEPGSSQETEQGDNQQLVGACGGSSNPGDQTTVLEYLGLGNNPPDQMFAVVPLPWCPHLELVQEVPGGVLDCAAPCRECGGTTENWVCLQCYEVYCGRYINEHMLMHGLETGHRVVLSYADLSVWCYACDSYVHHPILFEAKDAAHRSKFGEQTPH